MLKKVLIASLYFLISQNVNADENPLLGSWKMKEIHYIYPDKIHSQPKAYTGTFVFTPKRYVIMYNPWKTKRAPFKEISHPSSEEILASFKTIIFNSGSYTYNEKQLSTQADMAKVVGFEGGQQFYNYTIQENILDITMYDETYPDGKKPQWFGKLKVRFILEKE